MTNKYKISDLAKDFGLTSKDIITLVKELTGEEKKSGAALNEDEISAVFNALTKKHSVKSFNDYFSTGDEAKAKAQKERRDAKDKKLADQMAILEQLKAAAAIAAGETPKKEFTENMLPVKSLTELDTTLKKGTIDDRMAVIEGILNDSRLDNIELSQNTLDGLHEALDQLKQVNSELYSLNRKVDKSLTEEAVM